MAEYLAPGVYVEEIELGSRPIEGVSTSTTGFVGVARRGPVNKPVLVTNFGEYLRFFGGYLGSDYNEKRWLPYAVDGFFANGGKRAYITRIAKVKPAAGEKPATTTVATVAQAILPDRQVARRTLAKAARAGEQAIDLPYWAGLNVNDVLQLDSGDQAEYVQITGFTDRVQITPSLQRPHAAGVLVMQSSAVLTTLARSPANTQTASNIRVDGATLTANTPYLIDDGNQSEIVQVGAVAAGATAIDITPTLSFNHVAGKGLLQVTVVTGPATTTLAANAAVGTTLRLSAITGLSPGDWIQIQGNAGSETTQTEVVQLPSSLPSAAPFDVTVSPALQFVHDSGREVRRTIVLTANAAVGATTLTLSAITGLSPGDWIQIQGNAGSETEFVQLSSPLPSATPFNVTVSPPLKFAHRSGREVRRTTLGTTVLATLVNSIRLNAVTGLNAGDTLILQDGINTEFVQIVGAISGTDVTITSPLRFVHASGINIRKVLSPTPTLTLTYPSPNQANQGDLKLILSSRTGLSSGSVLELLDGAQTEYVQIAAPPVPPLTDPGEIALLRPLRYPHPSGTPVRLLTGTLKIIAGPSDPDPTLYPEVGDWGNQIEIQVDSEYFARTEVTQPVLAGAPALTVASAQGIETGSILQLPGNRYASVTSVQGNRVFLQGGVPAGITQADIDDTNNLWKKQVQTVEFALRFSYDTTTEAFRYLSMGPRHSRYVVNAINGFSQLVHVEDLQDTATGALNLPLTTAAWYPGGGKEKDLLTGIGPEVYVGTDSDDADLRTGLYALLNLTDVSIVAVPGQFDRVILNGVINHAERARYRIAVLDSAENAKLDDVRVQRSIYDSKYAALYYPWIQIFDPLEKKSVFAPPCGHVCGVYARTDTEVGVFKAPANAVVAQVTGLKYTITQGQQDILNPRGINVIRAFSGRGIRIWGARTISSDSLWRYVNVRRLFIFLEQSIDEATQYAVFEPNDVSLWERLRGSVTAFLTTQWRAGALQGLTAAQAFFVKVGLGETMTQDDIDNGRVIMLIGVAPVKPAEFVIFRITQMPRGIIA
jgi:phage tail sheath protein FI